MKTEVLATVLMIAFLLGFLTIVTYLMFQVGVRT